MSLDDETVRLAKAILGGSDSEITALREELLNPLFDDDTEWLTEDDDQFKETFNELGDDDIAELTSLVRDSSSSGISNLVRWLRELLSDEDEDDDEEDENEEEDDYSSVEDEEEDAAEPRFVEIEKLDEYPGWWTGLDTDEPNEDRQWKYVRSDTTPTDESEWLDQDVAFAAMTKPTARVMTDITRVDDYPGWWAGLDARDPSKQWLYVQSETTPTSDTTGWLDQEAAFAAMQAGNSGKAKISKYEIVPPDVELASV
jgi:hypothetical protein